MRARPAIAVAGVALAGLAGCGGSSGQARVRVPAPGQPGAPLEQAANGPVEPAAPGARPLRLRIAPRADADRPALPPPAPGRPRLRPRHRARSCGGGCPTRVLPIASLTKMMTALSWSPPAAARAGPHHARGGRAPGSAVGVLPKGRRVGVETMLHGLLLPSGNDAAVALALRVAGSLRAFVALMNERARAMGLGCTRFASPGGFVDAGNHSCTADLAQLARAVLDRPRLARIVRRRQSVRPLPIKGGHVWLSNNNPLLRTRYPGTIGVKTGYTDAAGQCLVAAVRRGAGAWGSCCCTRRTPSRRPGSCSRGCGGQPGRPDVRERTDGRRPSPPAARPITCASPPAPASLHRRGARGSTACACAIGRCPSATCATSRWTTSCWAPAWRRRSWSRR